MARALKLELLSLGYNVVEAVVGVLAGLAAGSVALLGFGLDSIVESSSAVIVLWRFWSERRGARSADDAERRAVRLVAVAFLALAGYVGARSVGVLLSGARPDPSVAGIVLAAVSVVVMPLLAWRKRIVARAMDSRSLHADSRQTTLCAYLSAVLLIGLAANSALGWWWADPVAGLAIAALAVREGRELWTTEHFCAC